jgi:hypothetical protein
MPDDNSVLLRQHLTKHWLTWSALNHFLPAPILRELFVVIVDQVSAQTIKFNDLFEECRVTGLPGLESWALRARSVEGALAGYLQHRLQNFLWRNDADAFPPEKEALPPNRTGSPGDLEGAVLLGRADFGTDPRQLDALRPLAEGSLFTLAALIHSGSERFRVGQIDGFAREIRRQVADSDPPIASAIVKHLGDLCADSDLWHEAKSLYDLAREKLAGLEGTAWRPYESGMRDIILQSTATATRALAGPGPAFDQLREALKRANLDTNPVLILNAPFDAITALVATGKFDKDAQRGTLLEPAFYQGSYDLDAIGFCINRKNFQEAQRQCWAVLRRQIALGLASETRATKSIFGRTILAALEQSNHQRQERSSFALAVRLLLESGDSTIDKYDWPKTLVDAYVDSEIVTNVAAIAARYNGTRQERELVAIEIFHGWLLRISDDKHDVADSMMEALARSARDEPAAFVGRKTWVAAR